MSHHSSVSSSAGGEDNEAFAPHSYSSFDEDLPTPGETQTGTYAGRDVSPQENPPLPPVHTHDQPPVAATKVSPSSSAPVLPDSVVFRTDPEKDDMGYRAVLETLTNPQTLNFVQASLRTVLLVAFPLFTISVHPNTMNRLGFPQMMIAAIVSTSTHQNSLGMQMGVHSWLWRGVAYMLVTGTVMNSWHVYKHPGAWYGMLAAGIFLASMVSHGMMRRFMYLYYFLYMLEMKMLGTYYPVIPMNACAWSAADFILGSVWGLAALLFPFPAMTKTLVDMIMSRIFEGIGKMLMAMLTFVWMPDSHAPSLFFADWSPFVKIEAILDVMAPLLWFSNWEPTEFPLRNPTRRLKLSLLRRIMALTYAAFGSGATIAQLRRRQAERQAMQRIRVTLFQAAHAKYGKYITNSSVAATAGAAAGDANPFRNGAVTLPVQSHAGAPKQEGAEEDPEMMQHITDAQASTQALRENSAVVVKVFGAALLQAMVLLGSVQNTPETIVTKVPFDALREKSTLMRRALRLEMLQVMKLQQELLAHRLAKQRIEEQNSPADDPEEEIEVTDDNSPFGRRHKYYLNRTAAMHILHNNGIIEETATQIRLAEAFFHVLLGMIAGELLSFGEQMKDYKPAKPLWRRLIDFFIIEPWNDFWEELWCRLTFSRPCDYRTVKDAIRMTCAYLAATALTLELYFIPGGATYFGTTLLLGLPVEEESLGMSINRLAGNGLGSALGFMAYHNTNNLAQKLAMCLSFVFIQRMCKDHPVYGQTFLYSASITMAGLVMTPSSPILLTRLITSNYTIVAYMLCVMFIFPNNNIKICWGYRCKLTKSMSDVVSDVALVLRLPSEGPEDEERQRNSFSHGPNAYPLRNTEAMRMCSQLNVQMSRMAQLLQMCDKWTPFAARQHVIRGSSPFPAAASAMIQFAHKRMVAHVHMLVFGVQLLHRPRQAAMAPDLTRIVGGNVADFLAEFAGCVRLVSQDFIDSLQASREWSYPLTLMHMSRLAWLRVRLFAIHFETYVIAAKSLSKNLFDMSAADYARLREKVTAPPPQDSVTQRPESSVIHVHVGPAPRSDAAGGTANPLSSVAVDEHPVSVPRQKRALQLHQGMADAESNNTSFVDRVLNARRLGDALPLEKANSETLEHIHSSIYLPETRESSFALPSPSPRKSFAHRVPLEESMVMPADAFPYTQESADEALQRRLWRDTTAEPGVESGEHRKGSGSHRCPPGLHNKSEGAEAVVGEEENDGGGVDHDAVKPKKRLSHFIVSPPLSAAAAAAAHIPLYRGPTFNFTEDELATEQDTDFSAIVTIMCSCYGLIGELEGLTGPMNTISTYQKDLHETSLATNVIDKLAAMVRGLQKQNYERYHYSTPPEEQRVPLHTQPDPFADWRF